jgi:phosphotransferase system enzyme I (PtsP)
MTRRNHDNIKLLCDIGELNDIFHDAKDLRGFLQKIVEMIAAHMKSDVCSIYLYHERTHALVLSATTGLNQELIGKVTLKTDEGLTGLSFKEMRAIREQNASRNPNFQYVPGLGEDNYESFIAVPIVRGTQRIGVFVIQNTVKDYFLEEDVRVLQAIAAQLANTIEMTRFILAMENTDEFTPLTEEFDIPKLIKGKAASPGLAFAPIFVKKIQSDLDGFLERVDRQYSLEDFHVAISKTEEQLEDFQVQIEENFYDVASLIFTAQILMLKDHVFRDSIVSLIKENVNPPVAVVQVVHTFIKRFEMMANPYFQEKSHDIRDVGMRILENLLFTKEDDIRQFQERIVIARELLPSDIFKMYLTHVKGIVLLSGGVTSHLSILARSLQIPLIIADHESLLTLKEIDRMIMDSDQGNIYVNPDQDVIDRFSGLLKEPPVNTSLDLKVRKETKTRDGTRVQLMANINLLSDLKNAVSCKAAAVGLYRTEFPFVVRNSFPSEEEQYIIYQKLVDGMQGKSVTFRTLDIGGDKVLSYFQEHANETNPFLGMRSIRFSLKHEETFMSQVKAILRAGHGSSIKIMFPMISAVHELLEAKALVVKCIERLRREKIPCNESPQIGMMVEIPSVVELIEAFAQHVDFFSIGSNDFIQYMLAVDRTNEKIADMYIPHHPSVLRGLAKVARSAQKANVDLSICGEMASEVKYLRFLLGIGVRQFSVNPLVIPQLQAKIMSIEIEEAIRYAQKLLSLTEIHEIAKCLH